MQASSDNRFDVRFWDLAVLAFLACLLVQFFHEGGHALVLLLNKRDPIFTFSGVAQVWESPPLHPDEWVLLAPPNGEKGWLRLSSSPESSTEWVVTLLAGPIASLLVAMIGLAIFYRSRTPAVKWAALMLSLASSLQMSVYYWRGLTRVSGDEFYASLYLKVSTLAINLPFALGMSVCLLIGFAILGNWKMRLKWFGVMVIGNTLGVGLIRFGSVSALTQIDLGNPWFVRAALGFSLPVFTINILAIVGLWLWMRRIQSL